MRYTIDAAGIRYEIETAFDADYPALPEIPISEAVEACHKIRDKQDAALNITQLVSFDGERHECRLITVPCECEAQGARKCGACE